MRKISIENARGGTFGNLGLQAFSHKRRVQEYAETGRLISLDDSVASLLA